MYSSAVFTGVDLFALKFHLDRVVPHQPLLASQTRDTGLPDGEDRIPLCFFRFDTIPQCDGQTDRRMDGVAVAYTALAMLALRSAVITGEASREVLVSRHGRQSL